MTDSPEVAAARRAYELACVAFREAVDLDSQKDIWPLLSLDAHNSWLASKNAMRALAAASQASEDELAERTVEGAYCDYRAAVALGHHTPPLSRAVLAALRAAGFHLSRKSSP